MPEPSIDDLRRAYHRKICDGILGHRSGTEIFSNADSNNPTSIDIAARMAKKIGKKFCPAPPGGQAAGSEFGRFTKDFIEKAFVRLRHIRPGNWSLSASQAAPGIARFEQYEHLDELVRVLEEHPDLKAALGGDYLITPDIVVSRTGLSDGQINQSLEEPIVLVNGQPKLTALRKSNRAKPRDILHASISCKWTIRSDRSQNSRTEALNLIRNRKGHTPHIGVVTFEPLPTRIASIAMGTGDIDATYHGALHELLAAVEEGDHQDQRDMLETLINGRRLRDISDLPFDIAI